MSKLTGIFSIVAIGALFLLLPPARAAGQAPAGYEDPPILSAADRVAKELITGPHHRVDDKVTNDGFMNHFTIHSDFGDFEASSERMLATRVREVYAIAKLRELSRSDAFSSALKGAATAPVDAAKQIVDDPVGTVKGIPGGVTRKVRGLYYKGRKTAHKVDTEVDELKADDEDADAAAGGEEDDSKTDKAKAAAKDYVGYSSALRELARKLDVDPYTTNPVLQAELRRLAQAAFAAGLGFKMVVPMPAAVGIINDVKDAVWDLPPEELERLNNLALGDMGIDKATRLEFFAGRAFTPTTQTLLVNAMKQLAPLAGRRSFIDLALTAEDEADAWLMTLSARMLAAYHVHKAPLTRLVMAGNEELGRAMVGVTADNKALIPVPFDHVTWQAGMEGEGPLRELAGRQLWMVGTTSTRAEKELTARGFEIHPRALEQLEKIATGSSGQP